MNYEVNLTGLVVWPAIAAVIMTLIICSAYTKVATYQAQVETCEIVSEGPNELRVCVVGLKQALED